MVVSKRARDMNPLSSEPAGDPVNNGAGDRREPTMTLAGWRRFVDTPAASFQLLPDKKWQSLSLPDKDIYNDARINYHSEMIIVATSTIREVARQGRLLTLLNRRENGARRGLIISGPQTTGKAPHSNNWAEPTN